MVSVFKQLSVSSSHFSNIWNSLLSDLGYCLYTDLILIVFDPTSQSFREILVHQTVLLPLSPILAGLVRDNTTSHPSIICEDISLQVLQCFLTLVYTGNCVLSSDCSLSDLQTLMKNLGMDIFNNLEPAIESTDDYISVSPKLEITFTDQLIQSPKQEILDQDCSQPSTAIPHAAVYGIRKLSVSVKSKRLEASCSDQEVEGEHVCTECGSSFSSLAWMYYHMATQHVEQGTEGYKCRFCPFSISKKNQSLLEHLMVHTGEKNWVCRFCGKKFRARKTLSNHERLHTGEKKLQCDKCNARFVQKTSLVSHIKTHHRNTETEASALSCRFCGREFKFEKTLKNHLKLHIDKLSSRGDVVSNIKQVVGSKKNEKQNLTCSSCPAQLPTLVAKKAHERKHTQPSVWAQCDSCRGFYQVSRGSCRKCDK